MAPIDVDTNAKVEIATATETDIGIAEARSARSFSEPDALFNTILKGLLLLVFVVRQALFALRAIRAKRRDLDDATLEVAELSSIASRVRRGLSPYRWLRWVASGGEPAVLLGRGDLADHILTVVLISLTLNVAGAYITKTFESFLFLDMAGTFLAGFYLGPVWGALVGFATNVLVWLLAQPIVAAPLIPAFAIVNSAGGFAAGLIAQSGAVRERLSLVDSGVPLSPGRLTLASFMIGFVIAIPLAFLQLAIHAGARPGEAELVAGLIRMKLTSPIGIKEYLFDLALTVPDKGLSVLLAVVAAHRILPATTDYLARLRASPWQGIDEPEGSPADGDGSSLCLQIRPYDDHGLLARAFVYHPFAAYAVVWVVVFGGGAIVARLVPSTPPVYDFYRFGSYWLVPLSAVTLYTIDFYMRKPARLRVLKRADVVEPYEPELKLSRLLEETRRNATRFATYGAAMCSGTIWIVYLLAEDPSVYAATAALVDLCTRSFLAALALGLVCQIPSLHRAQDMRGATQSAASTLGSGPSGA